MRRAIHSHVHVIHLVNTGLVDAELYQPRAVIVFWMTVMAYAISTSLVRCVSQMLSAADVSYAET